MTKARLPIAIAVVAYAALTQDAVFKPSVALKITKIRTKGATVKRVLKKALSTTGVAIQTAKSNVLHAAALSAKVAQEKAAAATKAGHNMKSRLRGQVEIKVEEGSSLLDSKKHQWVDMYSNISCAPSNYDLGMPILE